MTPGGTSATGTTPDTRPEIPTRLLVHALLREDGTVDAGELYTVAEVLGMTGQQVRLCVRRLAAEGRFTQEGRGRKAVLRAVTDPSGVPAPDAAYVRHAYRQDQGLAPWDGVWHLFAFAIPESRRTARDALRDTLLHLGAAPLQGGLYVTANPVAPQIDAQARHLGVEDAVTVLTSTDLRIGGLADPAALAAALWPLEEIASRYRRLTALAETCRRDLDGEREPATAIRRLTLAIELAAAFTEAMRPDPLLPPELLPRPWAGARARGLAATCWTRLRESTPPTEATTRPPLRLFRLYADALPPTSGPPGGPGT